MEPDRKAMPPTESIRRELIRGTLWSWMVEQPQAGEVIPLHALSAMR